MLKHEIRYDFKKELLKVHKKDIRNYALSPEKDELALTDGTCIVLCDCDHIVVTTAAKDFCDYLFTSMNVGAMVTKNDCDAKCKITVRKNEDLGDASGYKGHRITVGADGILIEGYDEKGIAQAFYYLEDMMSFRKAPYLKIGTKSRKARFEKRSTHSPIAFGEFPEPVLATIAHFGFDAIELWIDGTESTLNGPIDMHIICEMAKKYGLDTYIMHYEPHSMHPDDPGAEAFYDRLYGKLFGECPDIKGIVLSGEAARFASKDPDAVGRRDPNDFYAGIPTGKPASGWWPCNDFPQFFSLIAKCIKKQKPDAEIILSTYNWGWAPEDKRRELIANLSKDVILRPSWDIFGVIEKDTVTEQVADYSLSYIGPSDYFASEAKAANESGLKLYCNAQCSGRTWDYGLVPYEPMPYQWIKRFGKLLEANEKWNLCGLLENIHYGFHPSMITEIEKFAFFTNAEPMEEILEKILVRDYGEENLETIKKALMLWSESITHYNPTDNDQYGAFRIGPAYPMWIYNDSKIPAQKRAFFGNSIYHGKYSLPTTRRSSPSGVKFQTHFEELEAMIRLMKEGIDALEKIENPNEALQRLINLGKYIYRCNITGYHVKKHHVAAYKLEVAPTFEETESLLAEIEGLLWAERENVLETIPLVRADSRLGWEPSMEYMGDEKCLDWKLKQLDHEINVNVKTLRGKLQFRGRNN